MAFAASIRTHRNGGELWLSRLVVVPARYLAWRASLDLVGLRFALGVMWLTLIFAETIAAQSGIGYMAMQAREFMQTDVIVLSILLYAFLGKGANSLVKVLERWQLGLAPRFARTAVTPMSVAIEHDTYYSSRPAAGASLMLRGVRKAFGAKTVFSMASIFMSPLGSS